MSTVIQKEGILTMPEATAIPNPAPNWCSADQIAELLHGIEFSIANAKVMAKMSAFGSLEKRLESLNFGVKKITQDFKAEHKLK